MGLNTKENVLLLLSDGETLSGEHLSERLNVTRAAVWKAVEALRADGYAIESSTRVGYRLTGSPDLLTAGEIGRYGRAFPGAPLFCHAVVEGSTNQVAKSLAADGAAHGTAVIADSQTGGRGRFGRSFFSPPGRGMYLSLIVRPDWPPERLSLLTILTAVTVCDAVEAVCDRRPGVKWVNDLFLDGRKICGILTELTMEGESGQAESAVIGVGVNVNGCDFPPELQDVAGSLEMCAGQPIRRARLAAKVLTGLEEMLSAPQETDALALARYRADCLTVGREVTVTRQGIGAKGNALSVEDDGALLVRFEDGHTEAIRSGEATLRE